MAERAFRNTFAPTFDGKTIDVATVIEELRHGLIREADLPSEVHAAVAAELDRREREWISPDRVVILLVGTMGEVRGRELLHRCAFLVDMEMYSRESRDIYTMFGWRPHAHGPRSEWFGRYVDEAVRDGLVEEFPAVSRHSGDSVGYRLTGLGKEVFDGLLGTFQKDVDRMKEILAGPAPGHTASRICARYPEYAKSAP